MACNCKNFLKFKNGLNMPQLGIGTWMASDTEIETALNLAIKAGYRHIDTAPVYGNEKAIGRVLKSWIDPNKNQIKRDDIFITTKLPPSGNRASSVEKFLKNSLADLQLSYVDLYLIHCPFGIPDNGKRDFDRHENGDVVLDTNTNHVETWKKMEEMVKLGLVKSIGISNFNSKQIQRIVDNSTIKPSNLQVETHIYFQQNELVDFCNKNDITVTAYAPLGSKGIADINKKFGVERQIPNLLENKIVLEMAGSHKKTPAQILLRWIIQRSIAAIPKSTNPQRLQENLNIFDFELSNDDMINLKRLDQGIRLCDFEFFQGMKKHPEFPW